MKAIRKHRYGGPDVLELVDVELPALAPDHVRVRVRAASVNALDWHLLRARPHLVRLSDGLRRPKSAAVGVDAAGIVEAVGADVTDLRPGQAVFGIRTGAFAEYVDGATFVPMPAGVTFAEAAALPTAALTALQALRDKAEVVAGQHVLVDGPVAVSGPTPCRSRSPSAPR